MDRSLMLILFHLVIFSISVKANNGTINKNDGIIHKITPAMMDSFFAPSSMPVSINEDGHHIDQPTTVEPSSTSTIASDHFLNDWKICVTLSPERISTRNKGLYTFECQSRICNHRHDESSVPFPKFERPVFDWKTDLQHLLLVNGSCDESRTLCRYHLEVNIKNFVKEMDMANLKQMKISCNVADFVQISDITDADYHHQHLHNKQKAYFHYISGEADAQIKIFKGNQIHHSCNQTSDCGENMVCTPSPSKDGLSSTSSTSYGYCECPNESLRILQSGHNIAVDTYTLVIDRDYDELVCARKRSLNESCEYHQQCESMDLNSYCKPIYSIDGFVPRMTNSICDCSFGFVADQHGHCVDVYVLREQQRFQKFHSKSDVRNEGGKSGHPKYPTVVPSGVYIWWVLSSNRNPFTNDSVTSWTKTRDRIAATYNFLWQRYTHQRILTQIVIVFMLFIPFIIMIITSAYLHYYRRMLGQRQYKPSKQCQVSRTMEFNVKPISMTTMVDPKPNQITHDGYLVNNKKPIHKSAPNLTDKMILVQNDDLDQYYQVKFQ